ncbi:3-phosphoglycerate dehydrogenase [Candidatus Bathyarchaeota archaeon]|nr:3-phosphoglycerate dehydrogenase [Candidatus Bathyarchaeota archaeon]
MPFPVEAQRSWCLKYVDPSEVEFSVESIDLSEDEMCEAVSDADMILAVPMTPFMSRRVLEAAKKLKLVKFGSVGYDRIDLEAAVELGIPVTNNAGINAITVAEHALMMILVLQKKAFLFHEEVMEGSWPSYTPGDMWELRGRNLGILGLGAIGTELAKIARGFGAKILYNKRNRLSGEAEAELGVEYRSLEDLLKESDVLSVHVPLTDETRHIIGKDQVAMMKDGAIVVNTSRRDVVDESALSEALRDGKLYGVGIDVPKTCEEQAEELSEMFKGCNAVTTSHVASGSGQLWGRFIERLSESVRRHVAGEPPRFLVTP